jgi:hypothetical protein
MLSIYYLDLLLLLYSVNLCTMKSELRHRIAIAAREDRPKGFWFGGRARGQTMSEYALLLAGVAMISISAYRQLGARADITAVQVSMKLNGGGLPSAP